MKIRISLVDYLNSAPLGWAFLKGPFRERFEVISSTPARCADQLARGEVEIGLIPSIEYQRIPGLRIVPGIAIAATTEVRSVVLVRHRGRQVRSVAVDTSSRTSAVLVEVLLRDRFGLTPELIPHPPDPEAMLQKHDAALIIGDAALKIGAMEYEILDLARAWIDWQSKPFTFAFWACRADANLPCDLVATFQEASAWGLAIRDQIAAEASQTLGLSEAFLFGYLTRNIDYEMTQCHIEGLENFYRLAWERKLISAVKPLCFLRDPCSP